MKMANQSFKIIGNSTNETNTYIDLKILIPKNIKDLTIKPKQNPTISSSKIYLKKITSRKLFIQY